MDINERVSRLMEKERQQKNLENLRINKERYEKERKLNRLKFLIADLFLEYFPVFKEFIEFGSFSEMENLLNHCFEIWAESFFLHRELEEGLVPNEKNQ